MPNARAGWAMPTAVVAVTATAVAGAGAADGYTQFVIALVALTALVGVGLNVLLGLTGQVSLGHVGFYAIGAYVSAILTLGGWSFFVALPAAGFFAGAIGLLLAAPALRVRGPYLAMVTIAFAFIVEHAAIELKDLTGGANGLMGIFPPTVGEVMFTEREMAILAILLAGAATLGFERLRRSRAGQAMLAVKDAETAAQSLGLRPVVYKTAAFVLSAAAAGLAGAIVAPLVGLVSPGSFPFSQSILFLLAVVVGGAGAVFGPLIGAVIVVLLPELLSDFAEYRLLLFGGLLLVVLWLAPSGIAGAIAKRFRRVDPAPARAGTFDVMAFLAPRGAAAPLVVEDLAIAFGGVRAVQGVSFLAAPGRVTSVIGPNGAGKTTALNMIGGFYRPDAGAVRLGPTELAGRPAWAVARAGVARTYQTTLLFAGMGVVDNVLVGLRQAAPDAGGLGAPDREVAEALLAFVGYRGAAAAVAGDLPHVDRRLVEIARALALRPRVLLLDEPAAGLMRADKDALGGLLRAIANAGIAVVLVEHDMALVMGVSDHVVVLDAGRTIAAGAPADVQRDAKVIAAYLGASRGRERPRRAPLSPDGPPVLQAIGLGAGYGGAAVIEGLDVEVRAGETVALLGANGAGKSTAMKALSGLLRPIDGQALLGSDDVARLDAHHIARLGLSLVPEGRQVFPELSVLDNLRLGATARQDGDAAIDRDVEAALVRFPRLRARIAQRAGLLSGGEQQMLAVARGLMARPRILLLDEPSLGLAPAIVDELFDVLAELRDEGVTLLVVDQMAALALTVADRAYVLEAGRIVRSDDASALSGDPALEAAYLGSARASA